MGRNISSVAGGAFLNIREPKLFLNREPVDIPTPTGVIEKLSSAWSEFAKGQDGNYATIDDALRIRGLLYGIQTSSAGAKMVVFEA